MKEDKTLRQKLERLQVLVVDAYIEGIASGEIHPRDMAPIITLLNHNKVVTEAEKEESAHAKVKKIIQKKKEDRGE
jgi:hypothetical protein